MHTVKAIQNVPTISQISAGALCNTVIHGHDGTGYFIAQRFEAPERYIRINGLTLT